MDSQDRKREQIERHLRSMDKQVGHDEQKRRKSASRERRSQQEERGPRRREWRAGDNDWNDEAGFEKIARAAPDAAKRSAGSPRPLDESLPRARVVAVHRGRIELEDGRSARLAPLVATDPNDMRHRVRLAEARAAGGDKDAAADELMALGRSLLDEGKAHEAEKLFGRAKEVLPDSPLPVQGLEQHYLIWEMNGFGMALLA